MNGAGACGLGRLQNIVGIQVGARQPHRDVGLVHMEGIGIGVGIDRHAADAHIARAPHDAASDFAAIRDEESREAHSR